MILKVFSVLDTKGDVFMSPFFFPATGQAVRAFSDLANDGNTVVARHPGDYRLTCVGEFDDSTGRLIPYDQVQQLGYASDYKALSGTPVGVSQALKAVTNGAAS